MSDFDRVTTAIKALQPRERAAAKDAARALVGAARKRSACDRAVFDAILARINWGDGYAFPGIDTLVKDTGFARRSVIYTLGRLAADRILIVASARDGRTSNRYTLPGLVPGVELAEREHCTSAKDCTPLVQPFAPPLVQPVAPEPLKRTLEDNQGGESAPARKPKPAKQYSEAFGRFWQVYPRPENKHEASRSFEKLTEAEREQAIGAAELFAGKVRRAGTERRFIPHPTTWLNQKRYLDFEEQRAQPANEPDAARVEVHRRAVRDYRETGRWREDLYGPEPGARGCRVPVEILAEFGFPAATPQHSESARSSALH